MALPSKSIRIIDLERLDTSTKIDAKQELLLPAACNQVEKDTFSIPLLALVDWLLKNHAADRSLGNLDEIGQGIIDAKQDYFDKNPENTDLNTFTKDGIWKVKITGGADYHTPENGVGYFIVAVDTDDDGTVEQQARNLNLAPGNIYRRQRINNVWTGWSLITQDMENPVFTESPTVTNPGTNSNQLATLGQLWEKFADVFQTELHITEGLLVSGAVNYLNGTLSLQTGARYITNDSITVDVNNAVSLSLPFTGTHYIFAQSDGTLKSWTGFEKVVEIPETPVDGTLYYNIMTDEYGDGTTNYSLAPLGILEDGVWTDAQTIQFLNLQNLRAAFDALNIDRKVDTEIGDSSQNSLVSSDNDHSRTISATHYSQLTDDSYTMDYGAGVRVQTHDQPADETEERGEKNVMARMHAADGDQLTEIVLTPGKATLSSPRQDGVPYEIATTKDIDEVRQSALTFEGFVSTTDPQGGDFTLRIGNKWINSDAMPTTFPVPASSIKIWNGTSWDNSTEDYTSKDFDAWRNVNDNEGYYWFAGKWMVMSTDLSPDDFSLGEDGKWYIKESVRLGGKPTAEEDADTRDGLVRKGQMDTALAKKADLENTVLINKNQIITSLKQVDVSQINMGANVSLIEGINLPMWSSGSHTDLPVKDTSGQIVGLVRYVYNSDGSRGLYFFGAKGDGTLSEPLRVLMNPDGSTSHFSITPLESSNNLDIATTEWVNRKLSSAGGIPTGIVSAFAGQTVPSGWLICDGSEISRTTYSALFDVIGTIYGEGDGNSTFNLPTFNTGHSIVYGTPGLSTKGGAPNITGEFSTPRQTNAGNMAMTSGFVFDGGLAGAGDATYRGATLSNYSRVRFDASRSSSVYGTSKEIYASGLKMLLCIKY